MSQYSEEEWLFPNSFWLWRAQWVEI